MDHIWVGGGARGEFPQAPEKPGFGPNRPDGIYVIRFRNTRNGPRWKNFLRGYGFRGGSATNFNLQAAGFGEPYKKGVLDPVVTLHLGGGGECFARGDNYVDRDMGEADCYGIPVRRIHMKFGENEHAMIEDMGASAAEMMEAAGARNIHPFVVHGREPGRGIHEVGIARMGNDPRKSVLNQFQQSHDVKNLFVMDGSGFTSSACQNPTLTIMALCVRSCDYLMGEMKRGNI